jgi:hypothetical protein
VQCNGQQQQQQQQRRRLAVVVVLVAHRIVVVATTMLTTGVHRRRGEGLARLLLLLPLLVVVVVVVLTGNGSSPALPQAVVLLLVVVMVVGRGPSGLVNATLQVSLSLTGAVAHCGTSICIPLMRGPTFTPLPLLLVLLMPHVQLDTQSVTMQLLGHLVLIGVRPPEQQQ